MQGLVTTRQYTSISLRSLWSIGFGQVSPYSTINNVQFSTNDTANTIAFMFLANIPQGLISISFLTYNSILTCMLMEKEWNDYAHERKPLRVSLPTGQQRSTYYLQLPYSYAVPLITASGLMHWLVSQSIFLARVEAYDSFGQRKPENDVTTCGYSCIAIIFTIILGSVMLVTLMILSRRKYRHGMPFAGHCSAVLSAACHPPPADDKAAASSLMWGVVEAKDGVARYSFSSRPVQGEGSQTA